MAAKTSTKKKSTGAKKSSTKKSPVAKKSTVKKSTGAKKTAAKTSTAKRSSATKQSASKETPKKVSPSVADALGRVKSAKTRGQKLGAMMEAAGVALQKGAEIAETIKLRRAKRASGRKKTSPKA